MAQVANPLQKPGQIIRDMIDMGCIAAFQFPVLAHHFLYPVGHDQHGGMPSWCGTTRLRARSSNMAEVAGVTP